MSTSNLNVSLVSQVSKYKVLSSIVSDEIDSFMGFMILNK